MPWPSASFSVTGGVAPSPGRDALARTATCGAGRTVVAEGTAVYCRPRHAERPGGIIPGDEAGPNHRLVRVRCTAGVGPTRGSPGSHGRQHAMDVGLDG